MPAKLNKPLMDIRWEKNHWHGHLRFSKYFFFFWHINEVFIRKLANNCHRNRKWCILLNFIGKNDSQENPAVIFFSSTYCGLLALLLFPPLLPPSGERRQWTTVVAGRWWVEASEAIASLFLSYIIATQKGFVFHVETRQFFFCFKL